MRKINTFEDVLIELGSSHPINTDNKSQVELTRDGEITFYMLIQILDFLEENQMITIHEDNIDKFMNTTVY